MNKKCRTCKYFRDGSPAFKGQYSCAANIPQVYNSAINASDYIDYERIIDPDTMGDNCDCYQDELSSKPLEALMQTNSILNSMMFDPAIPMQCKNALKLLIDANQDTINEAAK